MRISACTPVRMHLSLHMWALLINLIAFITACVFFILLLLLVLKESTFLSAHVLLLLSVLGEIHVRMSIHLHACIFVDACPHANRHTCQHMCVCVCLFVQLHILACIRMSVNVVAHTAFETRKDAGYCAGRRRRSRRRRSPFFTSLINPARN